MYKTSNWSRKSGRTTSPPTSSLFSTARHRLHPNFRLPTSSERIFGAVRDVQETVVALVGIVDFAHQRAGLGRGVVDEQIDRLIGVDGVLLRHVLVDAVSGMDVG